RVAQVGSGFKDHCMNAVYSQNPGQGFLPSFDTIPCDYQNGAALCAWNLNIWVSTTKTFVLHTTDAGGRTWDDARAACKNTDVYRGQRGRLAVPEVAADLSALQSLVSDFGAPAWTGVHRGSSTTATYVAKDFGSAD